MEQKHAFLLTDEEAATIRFLRHGDTEPEEVSVEASGGNFPPIRDSLTADAGHLNEDEHRLRPDDLPPVQLPLGIGGGYTPSVAIALAELKDLFATLDRQVRQLSGAQQMTATLDRQSDAYHRISDLERRFHVLCNAFWPNQVPFEMQAQGPDGEALP